MERNSIFWPCARLLRRLRAALPMVFNLLVIAFLVLLDCRDLMYKTVWIGPTDSYSFRGGYSGDLDPKPLEPSVRPPNDTDWEPITLSSISASVPISLATSGWVSFLSRCEKIHPFRSHEGIFLSVLAYNCHVNHNTTWSRVVLTSSMRVDSIVWTSCQLIPVKRRPSICYEEVAADFMQRYHLYYPESLTKLPPSLSPAQEDQLQKFLEMASDSLWMAHRMICVEVMPFQVDQWVTPFAFGCASANSFQCEFVFADPMITLMPQRGWLTTDVLQIAGFQFAIRQNTKSHYLITNASTSSISTTSESENLHLTVKTHMNFSSFGHFYAFLLIIDTILLIINLWSSIEIFLQFIAPEYRSVSERIRQGSISNDVRTSFTTFMNVRVSRTRTTQGVSAPSASQLMSAAQPSQPPPPMQTSSSSRFLGNERNLYYSFFSRSLYRSTTIAVLTVVTQCLSWFIILPNSVIWVWSESSDQKFRAYQTSIRVWALLVLLIHTLWDAFAAFNERLAYQIVRRTYLTSIDIIGVIIVVSVVLRQSIFKICEIKWSFEHQRINDVDTFPGYLAHGNSLSISNSHTNTTPLVVVWMIYKPLVLIMSVAIGVCTGYGLVKFVYFSSMANSAVPIKVAAAAAAAAANNNNNNNNFGPPTKMGDTDGRTAGRFSLGSRSSLGTHSSLPARGTTGPDVGAVGVKGVFRHVGPSTSEAQLMVSGASEYHRLPMEVMLDSPIRARSLIRNDLSMETWVNGHLEIRPSVFADFGVMVHDGFYRSRTSFGGCIQPLLNRNSLQEQVSLHERTQIESSTEMEAAFSEEAIQR